MSNLDGRAGSERSFRSRRWTVGALTTVGILAVGAVTGWAASAVFAPPRDVLSETPYTFVELVNGEVGSSIRLNTVAVWEQVPAGANQAAGTVTSVSVSSGDEVRAGSVLYAVNLRPVVVAAGATPAFRALSQGSEGPDVQQLQQLLTDTGFYGGAVDGEFGARTAAAVREWQESLGVEDDGVVQAGDVIFVPSLPTRVSLDSEVVSRGATLSGGEDVVSALSAEPVFTIPATAAQAGSMPTGTSVNITAPDGSVWAAQVAGQETSEDAPDQVDVALTGVDGGSVCGAACALVPVVGESLLASEIITQATVAGVVSPSAALVTDADGTVAVIDEDGDRHEVSIVASARGMSVIDGVDAGLRVRVPAAADGTQAGSAP